MDYSSTAQASHYAAPPAYYTPSTTATSTPPNPSSETSHYAAPPAYYTLSTTATAAHPNRSSETSYYAAPPAYYTPSTTASATHPNPSSLPVTQAVQPYLAASTSTAYTASQYQHAPYASYAASSTLAAATAFAPAYYGHTPVVATGHRPGLGFVEHDLAAKKLKMIQGGTNADSVRVCTTCNVVCNSDKVFESHMASAKHIAKVSGRPLSGLGRMIGPNPKKKKKKAQMPNAVPKVAQPVYCEICKISCNDWEMYNKHVAGKKHNKHIKNATVSLATTTAITTKAIQFVPASNACDNNDGTETKNPVQNSIQKLVQSVYCDVCKITCNTLEMYNLHITGKKHNKNITNQTITAPATVAATAAATAAVDDEKVNANGELNVSQNKRKAKSTSKEDLEAKKRKMVENGTSIESVKVCELCNVVCSSQHVLDFHVRGQMHLSKLKKQEENNQRIEIAAPPGTIATTS